MAATEDRPLPCLLDVTLRDGGYVNNHSWTHDAAVRIITTAARANVPIAEIGYFRPRRHEVDGDDLPAASCPADYITRMGPAAGWDMLLAVMVPQADVRLDDYRFLAEHSVAMV